MLQYKLPFMNYVEKLNNGTTVAKSMSLLYALEIMTQHTLQNGMTNIVYRKKYFYTMKDTWVKLIDDN